MGAMRIVVRSKLRCFRLIFCFLVQAHLHLKGRVKTRRKHAQMTSDMRYAALVNANGLQPLWFEGCGVGVGGVRAVSTRRYHAKRVTDRRKCTYCLYSSVRHEVLTLGSCERLLSKERRADSGPRIQTGAIRRILNRYNIVKLGFYRRQRVST